jgi:hypothetical protein
MHGRRYRHYLSYLTDLEERGLRLQSRLEPPRAGDLGPGPGSWKKWKMEGPRPPRDGDGRRGSAVTHRSVGDGMWQMFPSAATLGAHHRALEGLLAWQPAGRCGARGLWASQAEGAGRLRPPNRTPGTGNPPMAPIEVLVACSLYQTPAAVGGRDEHPWPLAPHSALHAPRSTAGTWSAKMRKTQDGLAMTRRR